MLRIGAADVRWERPAVATDRAAAGKVIVLAVDNDDLNRALASVLAGP